MNAVLSPEGQVALPADVRNQLHLVAGDDFEVAIEGEDTITLRRVSKPANRGLVELLLGCPSAFDLLSRESDDSASLRL